MKTITIQDESATGKILHELLLELADEIISVKELIRLRVFAEVERYNAQKNLDFQGLIQPTQQEQQLNQTAKNKKKLVDAEQQLYVALEAFQNNGFFLLVDNQQVTDLDSEIILTKNTAISFIKLTPLVGG